MKKVIMLVMVALGAIGFTGCSTSSKIVKVPSSMGSELVVRDIGDNKYSIRYYKIKGFMNKEKQTIAIKGINFAKKYGKLNGYKYMAIVNEGTNNLAGFPINDMSNMKKYLSLDMKGHYNPRSMQAKGDVLIKNKHLNLKVMYFKEAMPGLFLWKL